MQLDRKHYVYVSHTRTLSFDSIYIELVCVALLLTHSIVAPTRRAAWFFRGTILCPRYPILIAEGELS